jgi:hypothetical protein
LEEQRRHLQADTEESGRIQRKNSPVKGRVGSKSVGKKFIPYLVSVLVLIILVASLGMAVMNNRLIRKEIRLKARTLIESIILARRWNASFGGVFVEKKENIQSNPFLTNPDVTTVDGRVYTMKNPALMTREISNLAKESEFFEFKMTSLKPLNPSNRPDDFEREALMSFEKGEEIADKIKEGPKLSKYTYNYMVPLYTEKDCLQCHQEQGYEIGNVRGGISIRFDVTDVKRALFRQKAIIWALFAAVIMNLAGILYFLALRLKGSPN